MNPDPSDTVRQALANEHPMRYASAVATRTREVLHPPLELLGARDDVRAALPGMLRAIADSRLLSGADLMTLALLMGERPVCTATQAAVELIAGGLRWPIGPVHLASVILDGIAAVPGVFVVGSSHEITFASDEAVRARLKRVGFTSTERKQSRTKVQRPVRRHASAPAQEPKTSRKVTGTALPPQASKRQPERTVPARVESPTRLPKEATLAAPPTNVVVEPPPVELSSLSTNDVDHLLRTRLTLADLSLAVRAHTLASAATFTELLSPQSMTGVVAHSYQQDTVRRVLRVLRGRALLADEVGLGKTVEAILTLREYQLRGMARRILVIVPPALVRQWCGELLAKAGISARTLDDDMFSDDPTGFVASDGIVVASLAKARSAKNAPLLQSAAWDLVIVDEAHHIKKQSTLSYKLVDGLKSRFLLLLTATPIETSLEELFTLVTLLKPGQLTTAAAFKAQFVDKADPTSPKNRERLRQLLGDVMVRNTRAACGLKLPPRFVTTAVVDPLPAERALYESVVELVRFEAQTRRRSLLAATLLLEAGSSPAAVRGTLERAKDLEGPAFSAARDAAMLATQTKKLEQLVALVRAHGGHVLVFTRFRATLEAIEHAFNESGIRHVALSGAQSANEKARALDTFREERCALVSTDVGAEGTNLQHCNVVVSFDVPWNPMLLEQRIGRVHRMGQTRDVHVYNLALKGSAEEKLLDVLDRRLHLFELVVGEMDMVLGNLADERDLEERVLALYAESKSEGEVDRGFDALAAEIGAARGSYESTRKLDEAVFGEDFAA